MTRGPPGNIEVANVIIPVQGLFVLTAVTHDMTQPDPMELGEVRRGGKLRVEPWFGFLIRIVMVKEHK